MKFIKKISIVFYLFVVSCQGLISTENVSNSINKQVQPTAIDRTDFPPIIQAVEPVNQSVISTSQQITVHFSKPMQKKSVEAAVEFSPIISGAFNWLDDQTVNFVPDQELLVGQNLIMRIDSEAQDLGGRNLAETFEVVFKTAEPLRIGYLYPENGAINIDPGLNAIIVSFSQPVANSLRDASAAFRIEPETVGEGKWFDESTFIFTPADGLIAGTNYQVIINRQLKSQLGTVLEIDTAGDWRFQTTEPEISDFSPTQDQEIPLDQEFIIQFNQPMQTESVAANFRFHDVVGNPVLGRFFWNEEQTEMRFIPQSFLERGTTYQLELLPGSIVIGGGRLEQQLILSYTTIRDFSIVQTFPEEGIPVDLRPDNSEILFYFSTNVSREQNLDQKIKIFPEIDRAEITFGDAPEQIKINGEFTPGVNYQVLISDTLQDEWGGELGDSYIYQFTVSPPQPAIKFLAKEFGETIVLEPYQNLLPVEVINYRTSIIGITEIGFTDYQKILAGETIENFLADERTFEQTLNSLSNTRRTIDLRLQKNGSALQGGLYIYRIYLPDQTVITKLLLVNEVQIVTKTSKDELYIWLIQNKKVEINNDLLIQVFTSANEMLFEKPVEKDTELVVSPLVNINKDNPLWVVVLSGGKQVGILNTHWNYGVSPESFAIPDQKSQVENIFLETDSQIYHPGDQIDFYGIVGMDYTDGLPESESNPVTISLRTLDSGNVENQFVQSVEITIDSFGTFDGSLSLPAQISAGIYQLNLSIAPQYHKEVLVHNTTIEDDITMQIDLDQTQYRQGQDINAKLYAKYSFGSVATGLQVFWRIKATRDESALRYNFEGIDAQEQYEPVLIKEGKGTITPDGFLPVLLSSAEIISLNIDFPSNIYIEAGIFDGENRIILTSTMTKFFEDRYLLEIETENFYETATAELDISIRTLNLDRKQIGAVAINVFFQKAIRENGSISGSVVWTDLFQTSLVSDGNGFASFTRVPGVPGVYKITAVAGKTSAEKIIWVGGSGLVKFPMNPNNQLPLILDQNEYASGDTARLFIPNPFGEEIDALITIENKEVIWSRIIRFNMSHAIVEIPIEDPSFLKSYISVVAYGRSTNEAVVGYEPINIRNSPEELKIETTFQKKEPSNLFDVDVHIKVLDENDQQTASRIFFRLYGENLSMGLSKNPFSSFIGSENLLQISTAGFFQNISAEIQKNPQEADTVIHDYSFEKKQTILFSSITTDENGESDLLLKVPSDPVEVNWELYAISQAHSYGEKTELVPEMGTGNFLVSAPDKVMQGDQFQFSVDLKNNLDFPQTFNVLITTSLLEADRSTQQSVLVNPGDIKKVSFSLSSSIAGRDTIAGSIENPAGEKWHFEKEIIISPYPVIEQKTFSGNTAETESINSYFSIWRPERFDTSEIEIEASSSLSVILEAGIGNVSEYPVDSAENASNSLLSNLFVYDLIQKMGMDAVEIEERLKANIKEYAEYLLLSQNLDGGWEYSSGLPENELISTYSLWALNKAEQNGITIPDQAIRNGKNYLLSKMISLDQANGTWDYDLLAFQYYVLLLMGETGIDPGLLYEQNESMTPAGQSFLALALSENSPSDDRISILLDKLTVGNLTKNNQQNWMESLNQKLVFPNDVINLSVSIFATSQLDPANERIDEAIKTLLSHQISIGEWNNLLETTWAIGAISVYLRGTGNILESAGGQIAIDGSPVLSISPSLTTFGMPSFTSIILENSFLGSDHVILINQTEGSGAIYYQISIDNMQVPGLIQPVNRTFFINKYIFLDESIQQNNNCLSNLCLGSIETPLELERPIPVVLAVSVPEDLVDVIVSDRISAGMKLIDSGWLESMDAMSTFSLLLDNGEKYFSKEIHSDNLVSWHAPNLPAGTYYLTYFIMPSSPGKYGIAPAIVQRAYYSETLSLSNGMELIIPGK